LLRALVTFWESDLVSVERLLKPSNIVTATSVLAAFSAQSQRQAGDEEGCEEEGQNALARTPVRDDFSLGGIKVTRSAGVSTITHLHAVATRFDRDLNRLVHVE
jgi:hypothetical protein